MVAGTQCKVSPKTGLLHVQLHTFIKMMFDLIGVGTAEASKDSTFDFALHVPFCSACYSMQPVSSASWDF